MRIRVAAGPKRRKARIAIARKKFRVGQNVHLTRLAFAQGLEGRGEYHGVVTSVGPRQLVSVRRLGRKQSQSWNMVFWTVCKSRRACRRMEGVSLVGSNLPDRLDNHGSRVGSEAPQQ